jgi:mRNA-degrading endonuclease YafQ of YafQ-DinJ toxin-antitoxin module
MARTLIFPSGKARKQLYSFLKKHPELEARIERVLTLLLKNPLDQSVGAHKLTGQLKHFYFIS